MPTGSKAAAGKIVALEFARGIASIIVVFHHFALAFLPRLKDGVASGGLLYTPLYPLLNGSAAVVFFFVLSGYVLTARFYRSPSPAALAASVVKRLPRLMLPAAISIAMGLVILLYFGGYYREAASLTGAPWLASFGNTVFPPGFQPSVADAARQSLLVFLASGHAYYNSNLWTMVSEYYGSLVVFGILALFYLRRFAPWISILAVHGLLIVLFVPLNRPLVAFVAGSLIAYLLASRGGPDRLTGRQTAAVLIVALVGFSTESWWAHLAASSALMAVGLFHDGFARAVSGPVGSFVGMLSFPLYLVHTLVILSVTSFVYVDLHRRGLAGLAPISLSLLATLAVSLLLSLPLMLVDTVWVRWLGGAARRAVALLAPAAPAGSG